MRVVHLDGDLLGEVVERVDVAWYRRTMSRTAHATRKYSCSRRSSRPAPHGVRRIEHLRDRLGVDLPFDRADVVAGVEDADVELVRRARGEEPQHVHGPPAVADDRHVVRHARSGSACRPIGDCSDRRASCCVRDAAVHRDDARVSSGALDQPRRCRSQPVIGLLVLLAVHERLPEQAELVVDAVAEAGIARAWPASRESRRRAAPGRRCLAPAPALAPRHPRASVPAAPARHATAPGLPCLRERCRERVRGGIRSTGRRRASIRALHSDAPCRGADRRVAPAPRARRHATGRPASRLSIP